MTPREYLATAKVGDVIRYRYSRVGRVAATKAYNNDESLSATYVVLGCIDFEDGSWIEPQRDDWSIEVIERAKDGESA